MHAHSESCYTYYCPAFGARVNRPIPVPGFDFTAPVPELPAKVTFHLENGKTVSFDDVNIDSIGPAACSPGVVGVEFENDKDRIVHVPFVVWWEFSY